MVVDNPSGAVIEYALGNSYPGEGSDESNLYYLGPLFYATLTSDGSLINLQTKKKFDKGKLAQLKKNNKELDAQLGTGTTSKAQPSISQDSVSPNSIINYEYDFVNGVPDYQQNDNDSMLNDCVPTSGAEVVMYWDSNGYPNLSSSNDWINVANRLGVLMNHDDSYGVHSSDVASGMNSYFSEKGYGSTFSAAWDTSPTFGEMKSEVGSGHPGFLRLIGYGYNDPTGADGGHMVVLVGYETYTDTSNWSNPQYAIVHDNWESTGTNVYLLLGQYGSITDMWKIRN